MLTCIAAASEGGLGHRAGPQLPGTARKKPLLQLAHGPRALPGKHYVELPLRWHRQGVCITRWLRRYFAFKGGGRMEGLVTGSTRG